MSQCCWLQELTKSPSLLPSGLIKPCSYVAPQCILPSVPVLLEVLVGDLIVVLHHLAWLSPAAPAIVRALSRVSLRERTHNDETVLHRSSMREALAHLFPRPNAAAVPNESSIAN